MTIFCVYSARYYDCTTYWAYIVIIIPFTIARLCAGSSVPQLRPTSASAIPQIAVEADTLAVPDTVVSCFKIFFGALAASLISDQRVFRGVVVRNAVM